MDLRTRDHSGLQQLADFDPADYRNAVPFPHAVFHGVFDEALLDEVVAEFPDPASMDEQFDGAEEVKSAESRWATLGPATQELITLLNSAPFVDELERITGIGGLITDHHLSGGGQHQISSGGFLGVHADFNKHRGMNLDRRLNVLVYLNRDWDEDWGGHIELWDRSMTRAVVRQAPTFNTMVVFSTTSDSYHGHPDPLRTPPGVTRKSVATYYYTAGRDDGYATDMEHTTLFQDRPGVAPRTSRVTKALTLYKQGTRELLPDKVVERLKSLRG
jgi:hypothetical protein